MFAMLINGVELKGTCFASNFSISGNSIDLYPGWDIDIQREQESSILKESYIIANLGNNEILQIESFQELSLEQFESLDDVVKSHTPYQKALIKQYLFNAAM